MCSIIIGYKNLWSYGHPKTLGQMNRGLLGTCGNQYPTDSFGPFGSGSRSLSFTMGYYFPDFSKTQWTITNFRFVTSSIPKIELWCWETNLNGVKECQLLPVHYRTLHQVLAFPLTRIFLSYSPTLTK